MRDARTAAALAALVLAIGAAPPPAPAPERLPRIAAALAGHLGGLAVKLPDGSEAQVFGAPPAVLDEARLLTCLETIGEAGGWPEAWLVVQDASRTYDVVLRVALSESGEPLPPEPVFATPRREWDADSIEEALREATGKRPPRQRERNVVIQGFRTRIETTYVYEAPKTGREPGGLMSLLPPGAVLREARAVDLGDGRPHTLAIVLEEGRFVPSACSGCASRILGHADTGRIGLVLAGAKGIEDRLDLTTLLRGVGEGALLPRFACEPGDESPGEGDRDYAERFAGREPTRLIALEDRTGDGSPLEIEIVSEFIDCGRHASPVVGVDPGKRKLRVLFEKLVRGGG